VKGLGSLGRCNFLKFRKPLQIGWVGGRGLLLGPPPPPSGPFCWGERERERGKRTHIKCFSKVHLRLDNNTAHGFLTDITRKSTKIKRSNNIKISKRGKTKYHRFKLPTKTTVLSAMHFCPAAPKPAATSVFKVASMLASGMTTA
jgi:hypothetical protein